jgi:putative phosphoribosyl transferase
LLWQLTGLHSISRTGKTSEVILDDNFPSFKDRHDAGRRLADALMHLKDENPVVLALPRGGVPVAYEVARALGATLDVLLVRKIGAPGYPEFGLGAVVDGRPPQRVLNEELVRRVDPPPGYIEEEERRQLAEMERRRQRYCGDRAPTPVKGRTVIIVDDGIATGGTMKASLKAMSQAGVGRLVFAVPVAPREVVEDMRADVDEGICLVEPELFRAVGLHYASFDQTSDEEVVTLLGVR